MAATGYTSGDPSKVDIAGDTMTGPLILSGAPTDSLHAATKAYVDPGAPVNVTPQGNFGHGTPAAQALIIATGYAMLIGRIAATGANSGNAILFQCPPGFLPAHEIAPTVRYVGTGASTGALTIGVDGYARYNTALTLANGAQLPLDGIIYKVAT